MFQIFGANGYIGTRFRAYLPKEITPLCYDTIPADNTLPVDLTRPDQFDFSKIQKGDFILFLAAISRPDICKDQKEMAYAVNVDGTASFLRRFSEAGAHTLFFSSDAVYGPTAMEKVNEMSQCSPFGPYAEMKREIEKRFSHDRNVKVFRLSYVFSKEDRYTSYLTECARTNKEAEVFATLYRSVVYIRDIFDAILALSEGFDHFDNQVFNLSGPDVLSRKDLADIYKDCIAHDLQYRTIEPPEGFFDARPPIIATESLYLEKLLGRKPTTIREAMFKEYGVK